MVVGAAARCGQKWERQGRESGISRGWVVGRGVAPGKVRVILEAEGKSHEDVKDEELADEKSSGSHCGKVRGGRSQGAVQGPLELWETSPAPAHPSLLSHPTHSSPVPL